jgi:predicted Zn-dependent peptidase
MRVLALSAAATYPQSAPELEEEMAGKGLKKRWLAAGMTAAALLLSGDAQAAASKLEIATEQYELPNGLKVVLVPRTGSPTVGIAVYYDVGSANEVEGRSGFAHLFEHMMFQGSANVPKGGHFQAIFGNGGNMNGTTSEDRTNYYEVLPSDRLGLGLWLESDRMLSLAITQENFDNQREVVKEERRTSYDNQAYSNGWLAFDELAYTCWPYHHSTIGSMDDLNAAKLEDVQAFFNLHYKPNNAVLVIAGDFETAEAKALVDTYFASIPRGALAPKWTCNEPEQTAPKKLAVEDALATQPAVIIGWKVAPDPDPENLAAELLAQVLGGGEASRLYGSLVRGSGKALGVESFIYGRRGPDLLGVYATANGATADELQQAIEVETAGLLTKPVTQAEFDAAKSQLMRQMVGSIDSNLGLALTVGHDALYYGQPARANEALARLEAVTLAQVQEVANKRILPARATVVHINVKADAKQGGEP